MRDEEIYVAFGQQVAARRKSLGKSQKSVAEKVGLSRASIANIESGRQGVLLHQVFALADALDMQNVAEILPIKPGPRVEEEMTLPMTGVEAGSRGAAQIAKMISTMPRPALRTKK